MKKLFCILLALLLPTLALAEASYPAAPNATISVTGVATVSAEADYARVTVGVSTIKDTVAQASEANNIAIRAVIAALQAAGIPEEDIATSSYSVNAQYDYSSLGNKLTGYQVSNQLTVIIRDMGHIGATLDQATAAGANTIYNIEFLSTKAAAAQDEATRYAVQDALRKAELLASAAGLRITGIASISEGTNGWYTTARTYDAKLGASVQNSILPGDATINASVSIVLHVE